VSSVYLASYGTSTYAIYSDAETADFFYDGIAYRNMPVAFVNALMIYCQFYNL
jgi:hypothetical protein